MGYKVISFYKYCILSHPQQLILSLHDFCQKHALLGRILVGEEGLNGAISGKTSDILAFKKMITEIPLFSDLTFREQISEKQTYHKLVIKQRKEICAFGVPVNVQNAGTRLSPAELNHWYEQQEDFVIIDARNDYEYDVGRFKNAISLGIHNFRDFPHAIQSHQQLKDKKVVLYCTGGIRCEKASAYMKEQGFNTVFHVSGGIINYCNQFSAKNESPEKSKKNKSPAVRNPAEAVNPPNYWQGGLFVFDDRLVSDLAEPITTCKICHNPSQNYINCHNLACDKLVVLCQLCQVSMNKTCSESCKKSPRQRQTKTHSPKSIVGIVENYYPAVGVALVRFNQETPENKIISFKGKTTSFTQTITALRNDEGQAITTAPSNTYATFVVDQKVRKNDLVLSP